MASLKSEITKLKQERDDGNYREEVVCYCIYLYFVILVYLKLSFIVAKRTRRITEDIRRCESF